jgi:uncharacterized protein
MPVIPTYPGVYIEEIPSGVRTITGVPTANTAFLGRTRRGPIDKPVVVNGLGDFEREFGALRVDYPRGYALRGFFSNGGGVAVVQRVYAASEGGTGLAGADVNGLAIVAAGPGGWGNDLWVGIDVEGITEQVADRYNVPVDQLFNLTVSEGNPKNIVERILSVVAGIENPGSRRVDRILERSSRFIRTVAHATTPLPDTRPDPTDPEAPVRLGDGDDGEVLELEHYSAALTALEAADPYRYFFSLMCIPPDDRGPEGETAKAVYDEAIPVCIRQRALLIVDPPATWKSVADVQLADVASGTDARNAAVYFPRVLQADPLLEGEVTSFAPSGIIAGIMARTDASRGVWKAPAGITDGSLNGVNALTVTMTNEENGELNQLGVNCLRNFPVYNNVVWGARTLRGADPLASEWKYVPVRRLALFIEESLFRGTQWVVFEPNDEPLWAQIRLNVGAFMNNLFRQGAFQGRAPRDAYFVKCDKETTTQNDIDLGIVNIAVGFAPLKPAEFVILKLQQMAGQVQT